MRERLNVPEPTAYERIVLKNTSQYHYLKIQLVFSDEGVRLNAAQFKQLIISALKDLHGEEDYLDGSQQGTILSEHKEKPALLHQEGRVFLMLTVRSLSLAAVCLICQMENLVIRPNRKVLMTTMNPAWTGSPKPLKGNDVMVGASFPLDLLRYDEKTFCAILRICSSGLAKLWTSLTLLGHYQSHECTIRIIQVSPFLLALAGNSRELDLE